ncbi:hypothetical protein HKX48_004665 [Thoreauomyces humboldtii]|nr:hypothetical protein HKX48_004665 [Thoreauomyces humboldtii]
MDHSALRAVKNAMRKGMRAKLAKLSSEQVQQETKAVLQRLFSMQEYKQSRSVSVYISMPTGEICTAEIIRDILASNKSCYIPRCNGDVMDMVRLSSWEDYQALPHNRWRIPEPPLDEIRENALDREGLDLIIVPGLAFDRAGWRLGHGKGYYDKYFAKLAEWSAMGNRRLPTTVALALSAQIVDEPVPREDFDQKPQFLLTPDGSLETISDQLTTS